jgi:hypothetical protein
MRTKLFELKGPINEDRIGRIEKIVTRIARQSVTVAKTIIPPIPVSNFCSQPDVDSVVFRYMFPVSGKVTASSLIIDSKGDKDEVVIKLEVSNKQSTSYKIITTKKVTKFDDIEVNAGDRVIVKIYSSNADKDVKVRNIWISFLIEVTMDHSRIKSYLLDEIDRLEESYK